MRSVAVLSWSDCVPVRMAAISAKRACAAERRASSCLRQRVQPGGDFGNHFDGDHIEAIVKVLPKAPGLDLHL
jgi:hypothetical protein